MRCAALLISVDGDGGAVDGAGRVAGQEEDDAGEVFRRGPGGEVGIGHGAAVGGSVNDAGQDRVDAHAGTAYVGRERIHEGDGRGF